MKISNYFYLNFIEGLINIIINNNKIKLHEYNLLLINKENEIEKIKNQLENIELKY